MHSETVERSLKIFCITILPAVVARYLTCLVRVVPAQRFRTVVIFPVCFFPSLAVGQTELAWVQNFPVGFGKYRMLNRNTAIDE